MSVKMPWYSEQLDKARIPSPRGHGHWFDVWAEQVFYADALANNKQVYTHTFQGVIDDEDAQACIAWVKERTRAIVHRNCKDAPIILVCVADDAVVDVHYNKSSRDFTVEMVATDASLIDDFHEFSKDRIKQRSEYSGEVYMLGEVRGDVRLYHLGHGGVPLERGNYAPKVIESYDKMVRELGAPTPRGGLALIDGSPGTGKTFFVRGLIEAIANAIFIYIPASMIEALDKPSFVPALLGVASENPGPKILVIEDADVLLVERKMDNVAALSTLLNITDGTFGDLIDLRVIATTNARRIEIDKAMQRKGRVLDKITIEALQPDHANDLTEKLLEGAKPKGNVRLRPWTREKLLGDVYDYAIEYGWQPPTRRKSSFHTMGDKSKDMINTFC